MHTHEMWWDGREWKKKSVIADPRRPFLANGAIGIAIPPSVLEFKKPWRFFALINSSRTGRGAVYSSILHKVPVNRAAGRVFICKRGTVGRPKKRENEIYSVAFVALGTLRLNFLPRSGNMEKPTDFLFSSLSLFIDVCSHRSESHHFETRP